MKEIFKHLKGEKWVEWGEISSHVEVWVDGYAVYYFDDSGKEKFAVFSLADLLADKSWCELVWGEGRRCITCALPQFKDEMEIGTYCSCGDWGFYWEKAWKACSVKAFRNLQKEGEEACLTYIKKTMT